MSDFRVGQIVRVVDFTNREGLRERIEGRVFRVVEPGPLGETTKVIDDHGMVWWFRVWRLELVPEVPGAGYARDVDELVEELHGTDYSKVERHPMGDTKPTNPKDAVGSDKLPLHLFPMTAVVGGSLGLLDGMLKYGRSNWRQAGVRVSIYVDALERHLTAYMEGEDVDPDSGLPHLFHAIACLAILIDADAAGKLVDDRNFNGKGWRPFVEAMTPHVARLKEKHASRDPKHYSIADNSLTMVDTSDQVR